MATATMTQAVTLVLSKKEAEDLADYLSDEEYGTLVPVRNALETALKPPPPF